MSKRNRGGGGLLNGDKTEDDESPGAVGWKCGEARYGGSKSEFRKRRNWLSRMGDVLKTTRRRLLNLRGKSGSCTGEGRFEAFVGGDEGSSDVGSVVTRDRIRGREVVPKPQLSLGRIATRGSVG